MPHFPLLLCFTRAAANVFEWLLRPHSVSRRRILSTAISALALLGAPMLPAQESRLSNVAVRASAGGADTLITGFTIGPGPNKQVLVRAVGPTLGVFGVGDALTDPKLELYSGDLKIAENDDFNAADASTFASVGAFALGPGAKDAAIVTTLAPGSYTAQVTGIGGSGVALVEVYEVSGGTTRLVNLSTRAQVGTGSNILIPGITIAPGTGTRRLLLRAVGPTLGTFGVPGTLTDPKLELFIGTTKIAENDNWGTPVGLGAADAATLTAAFAANGAFALTPGSRDAALLLNLGAGSYTLQVSGVNDTTGAALVEVYDLTPVNQTGARPSASLYVASLRPDPTATGSLASGSATIVINADGTATVNVAFSNLSSGQTSAYLQLGASRDYVFNLQRGQVSNALWTFAPSGAYTTNDLITALNTGNISVGLNTANHPAGELRGAFLAGVGSQAFTPPAAPPAVSLTNVTGTDAARFLTQATFGPRKSEIDALTGGSITAWIDAQLAMPATSHRDGTVADRAAFGGSPLVTAWNTLGGPNRMSAWMKIAVTAPDQLRQRMAFALSQIFVVSDVSLSDHAEGLAHYYDQLANGAFGNFRTLLETVTLSPMMGEYLSSLRNAKANPATGTTPDENFAREVMQLFTIGLTQLQPDGTLKLDSAGLPIATYTQTTVTEMAKVFTGFGYPSTNLNNFRFALRNYFSPMQLFPAFHEDAAKNIAPVGAPIAANQGGMTDLKLALDALFNHANTAPFISRLLIQRFVTSNPSPGYVYRVAQKFENNGSGTRGDLGAVVRAILTDYEARSPVVATNVGYGKLKEPLLRLTQLFRALNVSSRIGRYAGFRHTVNGVPMTGSTPNPNVQALVDTPPSGARTDFLGQFGQAALRSPTVFNFFLPDYVMPGTLAAAGLVAPEFQITDDTFAITVPNELWFFIMSNDPADTIAADNRLVLDYTYEQTLVGNPAAVVDHLTTVLAGGTLPAAVRTRIMTALNALPANTSALDRARSAVLMVITSPSAAVQK